MQAGLSRFLNFTIVFLLATEGLFAGQYLIAGVAGYRWLEALIFALLLKTFFSDVRVNDFLVFYIKFLFLLLFFLLLKVVYLVFFEQYYDFSSLKQIGRLPFFIMIPYLVYYIAKKDIKYLKIILFIQVLIFSVAFFQFPLTPLTDLAWQLKFNYFMANSASDININSLTARVCSLYGYAIPFSYALAASGILSAYLYKKTNSQIYILAIIFMLIVAIMSLTRSVVLALLLLLLYIIFTSNQKNKIITSILIIGLISIGAEIFIQNIESFSRVTNIEDGSATGRIPLAITGLYTLLLHPFGVSPADYQEAKEVMFIVFHHPSILKTSAHNGIVAFGFYYTSIGLLVSIFIFYIIKKTYMYWLTKQMKIFFIIAFSAYLLQAFFHNNFIFVKDFYILIIVGLFMYEYEISKKKGSKKC